MLGAAVLGTLRSNSLQVKSNLSGYFNLLAVICEELSFGYFIYIFPTKRLDQMYNLTIAIDPDVKLCMHNGVYVVWALYVLVCRFTKKKAVPHPRHLRRIRVRSRMLWSACNNLGMDMSDSYDALTDVENCGLVARARAVLGFLVCEGSFGLLVALQFMTETAVNSVSVVPPSLDVFAMHWFVRITIWQGISYFAGSRSAQPVSWERRLLHFLAIWQHERRDVRGSDVGSPARQFESCFRHMSQSSSQSYSVESDIGTTRAEDASFPQTKACGEGGYSAEVKSLSSSPELEVFAGPVDKFQIFVKLPDCQRVKKYTVTNNSTIYFLKTLIEKTEGVPISHQLLIFRGKDLDNSSSFYEKDICDSSIITLLFRLCGGMENSPLGESETPPENFPAGSQEEQIRVLNEKLDKQQRLLTLLEHRLAEKISEKIATPSRPRAEHPNTPDSHFIGTPVVPSVSKAGSRGSARVSRLSLMERREMLGEGGVVGASVIQDASAGDCLGHLKPELRHLESQQGKPLQERLIALNQWKQDARDFIRAAKGRGADSLWSLLTCGLDDYHKTWLQRSGNHVEQARFGFHRLWDAEDAGEKYEIFCIRVYPLMLERMPADVRSSHGADMNCCSVVLTAFQQLLAVFVSAEKAYGLRSIVDSRTLGSIISNPIAFVKDEAGPDHRVQLSTWWRLVELSERLDVVRWVDVQIGVKCLISDYLLLHVSRVEQAQLIGNVSSWNLDGYECTKEDIKNALDYINHLCENSDALHQKRATLKSSSGKGGVRPPQKCFVCNRGISEHQSGIWCTRSPQASVAAAARRPGAEGPQRCYSCGKLRDQHETGQFCIPTCRVCGKGLQAHEHNAQGRTLWCSRPNGESPA